MHLQNFLMCVLTDLRAVFPEATEERYAEQLAAKRERVDTLFKDMSIPDIEVHRSKSEHYRLRYCLCLLYDVLP
jgi:hypothetical protein